MLKQIELEVLDLSLGKLRPWISQERLFAISKAADMQLARNLAVEWGPDNIRVNCIAPGLVRTDFARALWEDPELRKGSEDRTSLRRIGEPEDISGAAVFLASRAGRWITGQTIVIDGGRTIQ